jgi:hypothetical protein
MSVQGVFVSLPAQFVSGQVIPFAVGNSGSSVGMGCQVMEFCGSIMGALGHGVLLACLMQTIWKKSVDARMRLKGSIPDHLSANGMGPTKPIPPTHNAARRALTRRLTGERASYGPR